MPPTNLLSDDEKGARLKFLQVTFQTVSPDEVMNALKSTAYDVPTALRLLGDISTQRSSKDAMSILLKQSSLANLNSTTRLPRKRKALIIGINYYKTSRELNGCYEDILRMRKILVELYGFLDDPKSITVLSDHPSNDPLLHPTKNNIEHALKWLADGASSGDLLFLHYSGHGGRFRDHTKTYPSGYFETILPVDVQSAGHITDITLRKDLALDLPAGAKLFCTFDCCHSGAILKLPYTFRNPAYARPQVQQAENRRMQLTVRAMNSLEASSGSRLCIRHVESEQTACVITPKYIGDTYIGASHKYYDVKNELQETEVILVSSCAETENAADMLIPNWGGGGAVTLAICTFFSQYPHGKTLGDLYEYILLFLKNRNFSQTPVISSSQPVCLSSLIPLGSSRCIE